MKQLRLLASVAASDGVRQQFTTLFDYGVFDKFPRLKIVVLESGAGWIGYWLDRIDAVYSHTFIGNRLLMDTQKLALGPLEAEAARLQGDGRTVVHVFQAHLKSRGSQWPAGWQFRARVWRRLQTWC